MLVEFIVYWSERVLSYMAEKRHSEGVGPFFIAGRVHCECE